MSARVAVIGVGRIGAVTAIGLAHLDHDVAGIDRSPSRVASLSAGRLPEMEPGLRSALKSALRHRRLRFAVDGAPTSADAAFLCVDTPPGPGGAPDLSQVMAAARDAASLLAHGGVLVTRSTVPVGTGDRIAELLAAGGRPDLEVVHVPEFIREGTAWEDFRTPDRIVAGGHAAAVERVLALFAGIETRQIRTTRRTAELAKYAANAYLATSISFANEMAALGQAVGVVPGDIFEVLRSDPRIGSRAYLTPGLGFGGHCLPKDTAALEHLGAKEGLDLPLIRAVRRVNRAVVGRVVAALAVPLGGLEGRRIALAGLAFKAGTDDLRESPAVWLARGLGAAGATVTGWDPLVTAAVPGVEHADSLAKAASGADAMVVAHAWPGWRDVDPWLIRQVMAGRTVVDPTGALDPEAWEAAGFQVGDGRGGSLSPVPAVR